MPLGSRPAQAKLGPQERARSIADAATRLFAERGYASTSVADIAAGAGVTKPMIYRHFESKQDLCISLLEHYRDELIAAPLGAFSVADAPVGSRRGPTTAPAQGQLARMIDAWLSWVQAHPDATRLLFTPVRGDARVQQVQDQLFRRQRDSQLALLREFAPRLAERDAQPLAEITRAAFAALALWWLEHPDEPMTVPSKALLTLAHGIVLISNGPEMG